MPLSDDSNTGKYYPSYYNLETTMIHMNPNGTLEIPLQYNALIIMAQYRITPFYYTNNLKFNDKNITKHKI